MINWRNGKGGFVGGLKHSIKGFFQYAHSVTTESVVISGPEGIIVGGVLGNGLQVNGVLGEGVAASSSLGSGTTVTGKL